MRIRSIAVVSVSGMMMALVGLAQDAAPTHAQIEKALASARQSRVPVEKSFQSARDELLRLDASVEKQVSELVQYVSGFTDSVESGTEIANLKKDLVERLGKSLDWYRRERDERVRNLAGKDAETAARESEAMEERMDKRISEMLSVTASLAEHKDFQKYETYYSGNSRGSRIGDDGDFHQRVRPEYNQDRRAGAKGDQVKGELEEDLKKAISQLEMKEASLQTRLTSLGNSPNAASVEAELKWTRELLETRRGQLKQLIVQPTTGGEQVGDKEANEIRRRVEEAAQSIRNDWRKMQAAEIQYSTQKTRLRQEDARIARLEKQLAETP